MMDQVNNWHLTERIEHDSGKGDPFAAAIRATRMPMVITNPRQADNPIVFANQAFQKMTGYALQEIIGRNCRFLQGPDTDPEDVRVVKQAIANREPVSRDILNYRKDGTTFWNALHISPVTTEGGDVQFFFASQVDITTRVESEQRVIEESVDLERQVDARVAELREALRQKTTLIHEVDHRVKNNLSMISSLIHLQSRRLVDEESRRSMEMLQRQVDTLASVHSRLYLSESYDKFELTDFVKGLAEDLLIAAGREDIQLDLKLKDVSIAPNKAASMGLILTEIITNSLKYAFESDKLNVLSISIEADDDVRITIADNGPGYPLNRPQGNSLGRRLIERLAMQIDATTLWDSSNQGTSVTIHIPGADHDE
ncbi:MAG: PAS domain-containing protein [Inquilinaceae bacterium]